MINNQTASKILDYWFVMDFFNQDSYETHTNVNNISNEFEKYKKNNHANENCKKYLNKKISAYALVDGTKEIKDLINEQKQECSMKENGVLTFYVGKIKRQACIEKLVEILGDNIDQVEGNEEDISILSFQCESNGKYKEHSLSISAIAWAASRLEKTENVEFSKLLSIDEYEECRKKFEETYFGFDNLIRQNVSNNENDFYLDEDADEFAKDAISLATIRNIYSGIEATIGKVFQENTIEETASLFYVLYKDDAEKNSDENNYRGLRNDFFSDDLQMVKKKIESGQEDFSKGMLSDLVKYICGPNDILQEKIRYDLVKPEDASQYYYELAEILNVANAPIGKWPSRFMPALMQQVAINFATSKKQEGLFNEVGNVFSVNGPPGTGKTTLIKEIVANNIVEKAKILSQYDTPDDAFECINFWNGDINGGYDKFTQRWYRFKDERIADYGVLVVSSNNTAVENITKELPLADGILKNIQPVLEETTTNAELYDTSNNELMQGFKEIYDYFSMPETTRTIDIKDITTNETETVKDIYFTEFAKRLFEKENKEVWGLVAAPLGKKDNIKQYYYKVIFPLSASMNKNAIEKRIVQYRQTRKEFLQQLEIVNSLQKNIQNSCNETVDYHKAEEKYVRTKNANQQLISKLYEDKTQFEQSMQESRNNISNLEYYVKSTNEKCSKQDNYIKFIEQEMSELLNQKMNYEKQAFDVENSVGLLTKMFNKGKYHRSIELANTCSLKAKEYEQKYQQKVVEWNLQNQVLQQYFQESKPYEEQLRTWNNYYLSQQRQVFDIQQKINFMQQEIEASKNEVDFAYGHYSNIVEEVANTRDYKKSKVLNKEFVAELLSTDEKKSTKAHISNPWMTEEYNRAREKLFYLALQMTKEFALSSKCFRNNINILGVYWGYKKNSETKEKIVFHNDEKEEMMGDLLQTLFLLTPVVSSTFASVGSLLKDVKKPGSIGMLVVDEAGQAQPQMAIGALYRARRAIIVGDPKQVEPVVKDDLKILKKAYSEPVYGNYKSKSISVQSCADIMNPFGTFLANETDYPEWVGCPLVVHRRCISPMYEISNRISYDGIMKQQTLLPAPNKQFLFMSTQWINVCGYEEGNKNHYVSSQGKVVYQMVKDAFGNAREGGKKVPDLFIITPFTSVVRGLKKTITAFAEKEDIFDSELLKQWLNNNIGTVHKFQGKEADEVIFVLGCDESQKDRYAVTGFVNSNIVNVAVTRAKYRLYVVADFRVWKNNEYVKKAKMIMDTLPIQNIVEIEKWNDGEDKKIAFVEQAKQLPNATSFICGFEEDEYEVEAESFVSSIDQADFLNIDLSDEQYQMFGFSSKEDFQLLPEDIQKNIQMGIKLYFLLKPVYELAPDLDASCCGILFCKGMELNLRENFVEGLKIRFPDYNIRNIAGQNIPLQNAQDKDFMIGTVRYILQRKMNEIGTYLVQNGYDSYSQLWWKSFNDKLNQFANKRNKCCHPQRFTWDDMKELLEYQFAEDSYECQREPKIGGVFYESKVGKILSSVQRY